MSRKWNDGTGSEESRGEAWVDTQDSQTGTQTRSLGWTGYQLSVRELRGWLAPLPDHATIYVSGRQTVENYMGRSAAQIDSELIATWEVTP